MKDNRGFTLIELIVVIVIIGIIALITTPIISDALRRAKDKTLDEQIDRIISNAKKYAVDNDVYVMTEASEFYPILIGISELRNQGYLEDEDVINPVTEELMIGCVLMEYVASTGDYSYSYNEKCILPVRDYTNSNRLFYERENSNNLKTYTLNQFYNNYISGADLSIATPPNGSEKCYSYTMTGVLIDNNDNVSTLYDGSIIVTESLEGLLYLYRSLVNADFDNSYKNDISFFIDIESNLLFMGKDSIKNNPWYADLTQTRNFIDRFNKQKIYTKEDYCRVSATLGGNLTNEECLEVAIAGHIKLDNNF